MFHDQINVKYVDENNKSLLKDQDEIQLYGAYGENYMTEQKTFEGYELANVEGPTEGFLMRRYQLLFSITKIPVAPPKSKIRQRMQTIRERMNLERINQVMIRNRFR